MNSKRYCLSLLSVCTVFAGCARTVISSERHYPPTALRSHDAEFTAGISCESALGKSYTRRTKKHVYVYLLRHDAPKFQADFPVTAADLDWEVTWRRAGEPVIHFYDFPDGVSSRNKTLRRELLTKHYRYDPKADSFIALSE